jgi:hypothetical protein
MATKFCPLCNRNVEAQPPLSTIQAIFSLVIPILIPFAIFRGIFGKKKCPICKTTDLKEPITA